MNSKYIGQSQIAVKHDSKNILKIKNLLKQITKYESTICFENELVKVKNKVNNDK